MDAGRSPEQDGRVFVSPDVIGMIIALFSFTVAVLGGVGAMLARQSKGLDARFDQVDARFEQVDARFVQVDARFERLETRMDRLDGRMDRLEDRMDRLDGRMEHLSDELVGVKVAVARIEGPPRRLQGR